MNKMRYVLRRQVINSCARLSDEQDVYRDSMVTYDFIGNVRLLQMPCQPKCVSDVDNSCIIVCYIDEFISTIDTVECHSM